MRHRFLFSFLLFSFCSLPLSGQNQPSAEEYAKIAGNGSWCWFSDPRAIYSDGVYFGGYVDSTGSIWSFAYDPADQGIRRFLQYERLDKDDHANPSMAMLPDGRLVTFFSGHGGMGRTPLYYRISTRPRDISAWGELRQAGTETEKLFNTCYSNPAVLRAENNRTYLFYRGADFRFKMVWSDDLEVWSDEKVIVKSVRSDYGVRPYVKVANNGKDRIHIAFTDGHPRNETQNSIHYVCYRNGRFETASGREVATLEELPFTPDRADMVYDAGRTNERAWIWDVAYDDNDRPVLVYARFFSELRHEYWYARWDGTQWINKKISDAGRWFPFKEVPREKAEGEPHYSGGVCLDHSDPNVVYLSRPVNDVFEIEKWVTADMGQTWQTTAVTARSSRDNVRPFVPVNDPHSRVMWMYNYHYPVFTDFCTAIRIGDLSNGFPGETDTLSVKTVMKAVADWQIQALEEAWRKKTSSHAENSWVNGALYLGLLEWAGISDSPSAYLDWVYRIGQRNYWQVGPRMYHADDICIAQTYLKMYRRYHDKNMLTPTVARAEWVMGHPSEAPSPNYHKERWTWCDALFMAPAVYAQLYAITGQKKYLNYMNREFRYTYDFLYDPEERLFFRDDSYFDKREANGQKVFWGRGNGWVLGGLVNILKELPPHAASRGFYEGLFRDMCARIAGLQGEDGFWHSSLLDPASFPNPETSSSGFIVYGLAYGVNAGILDRDTYLPVIEKGWAALVSAVDTEGKPGWVQPIGQDPRTVTKGMTELYGTGAFLLAGSEVYAMSRH